MSAFSHERSSLRPGLRLNFADIPTDALFRRGLATNHHRRSISGVTRLIAREQLRDRRGTINWTSGVRWQGWGRRHLPAHDANRRRSRAAAVSANGVSIRGFPPQVLRASDGDACRDCRRHRAARDHAAIRAGHCAFLAVARRQPALCGRARVSADRRAPDRPRSYQGHWPVAQRF